MIGAFRMRIIESCIARARRERKSVVLPEGDDPRVLRAARRLRDEGIAEAILLGDEAGIGAAAEGEGISLEGLRIVDPGTNERLGHYAEAYVAGRPKASVASAERQLRKPLFHGGMMVKCGDAHAMVAGVANPTARIIKAGMLTIGAAPGIATPSSFFIMVLPELAGREPQPLLYADCAVNIEPDAEELADIALASAASADKLLEEAPRVALLSAPAPPGVDHPATIKVQQATAMARERAPGLSVEGALTVDEALPPDGQANVLIFPDLDAGNIAYKLTQQLAGASAIGPFLQGFARPVSDLSRGASVDDIVHTTAVLLATA